MSSQTLLYLMLAVGGLFVVILIAYMILNKKMQKTEYRQIQKLREGTKASKFSSEIMYQKIYLFCIRTPFLRRYVIKLRRRLEIVNIDDEYTIRTQTAKIIFKTLLVILPVTLFVILLTKRNILVMSILLIFELFLVETMVEAMADKIDNKLLREQIDFFAEIRHAYHEFNMVEEAIYQVSQDDELQVSRQGEKIYEVLISDDPESELEKYYDVAPNSFLKEFAGVSYLTKEFGDRKIDGASLYLKNLNNITQEMQLEILKRDKLDYVFQSLSVIAVAPILFLEPVKSWAISQFNFTKSFYNGKSGMIVQILIIILTFVCYILTRKLKDNGSTNANTKNTENPWQAKIYKIPVFKKIVDMFMPKQDTKDHRKISKLLKDSASPLKIEWLYVNRLVTAIATFVISLFLFIQLHNIAVDYQYTNPTTQNDILGDMSEQDTNKAIELTKQDNYFLDMFRGKTKTTQKDIERAMRNSEFYTDSTDEEITADATRVLKKLKIVNSEYFQWFEMLLALSFAVLGYMGNVWLLKFQFKMRQMEMENEVMQFQTIILMLMKIERVNVEIILEWLERYSNIFKEPISKCVNNYESGAWESLEELKEDISYPQLIRIIESLQAAVEKIPIVDAFDELDTEREYYQEKRKESNERLISKKGMIGKAIGFAPMVCLFVGYLIIPLVFIGLTSMTGAFTQMSAMK